MDILLGILREFGPTFGGILIVVGTMGLVIRYQNAKLEAAHLREIAAIEAGHARTLAAVIADKDRGWAQSAIWQQQAERLAERYTEATQLAADMSDEVLQRRRRAPR